jgi:5-methylcytosine-specific restriction endonuclease McrBC regulatory subunit McrC
MESAWLYNLLKDGTLVDNHRYNAAEGILSEQGHSIYQLNQIAKYGRSYAKNDDGRIWDFLSYITNVTNSKNNGELNIVEPGNYEHNTEDPLIRLQGTNARNFHLETGNLVGFVKQGDDTLKISSRFGDNFLKYIIADADGFLELKDKGGEKSEDDYAWLLAFLWNIKFKRACRLGLPKQYVSRNERLHKPRGNLDVVDFFQNAQTGRFACRYREHSYQNDAVSLMVAAYEAMERRPSCAPIIKSSRPQYRAFVEANAGLRRNRRQLLDTAHFSNPFYSDYNTVIDLSKRVLRNQGASFGEAKDSSAFLFDVSMLFEYFVRKLLQRAGLSLLPKSDGDHKIPTGSLGYRRDLQPDILFDHDDQRYVFDVKYKSFDKVWGAKREDLFQLHTYLGQFSNDDIPVRACGLIYPMREARWQALLADGHKPWLPSKMQQQGRPVDFFTIFLRIPDAGEDFAQRMQESCKELIAQIIGYIESPRKGLV